MNNNSNTNYNFDKLSNYKCNGQLKFETKGNKIIIVEDTRDKSKEINKRI